MITTDDRRAPFLAERRADLLADAPPVVPPCPSWCASTAELHPLEFEVEDGVYVRTHEAYSGQIVTVEATERSDGQGAVTLTEPALLVYGADYDGEAMSADDVMTLAFEMARAVIVHGQVSRSRGTVATSEAATYAAAVGRDQRLTTRGKTLMLETYDLLRDRC